MVRRLCGPLRSGTGVPGGAGAGSQRAYPPLPPGTSSLQPCLPHTLPAPLQPRPSVPLGRRSSRRAPPRGAPMAPEALATPAAHAATRAALLEAVARGRAPLRPLQVRPAARPGRGPALQPSASPEARAEEAASLRSSAAGARRPAVLDLSQHTYDHVSNLPEQRGSLSRTRWPK